MNKAEIISRHAQALKNQVGTSLAIDECEDIMASMMNEAINYTHSCESDSELLHTKVFNLANELAKAGYGNEAVRMHHICNGM